MLWLLLIRILLLQIVIRAANLAHTALDFPLLLRLPELGSVFTKLLLLLLDLLSVLNESLVDLFLLACCALHQVILTDARSSWPGLESISGKWQVRRCEASSESVW